MGGYVCGLRRMVTDSLIFLNLAKVSVGTPKTADSTSGGSLLIEAPIPMSSLPSAVLALNTMSSLRSSRPLFSK